MALLSACQINDQNHPILPGGTPGPVGGASVDGAVDDAGNGGDGRLRGRVCLVTDLRDVTACASTGAGGLTVRLGAKSATTAANGSFAIEVPAASNVVWNVSGANIQTSIAPFSATLSIPAIATVDYRALEDEYGLLEVGGQGAIVAHLVTATAPKTAVAMATAATSPTGAYVPFYDGKAARLWTQFSTGTHGAVWIPGLPAGTVALTVLPAGGVAQTINAVPVVDQAITFITAELAM